VLLQLLVDGVAATYSNEVHTHVAFGRDALVVDRYLNYKTKPQMNHKKSHKIPQKLSAA
jgi:hypothetical protein